MELVFGDVLPSACQLMSSCFDDAVKSAASIARGVFLFCLFYQDTLTLEQLLRGPHSNPKGGGEPSVNLLRNQIKNSGVGITCFISILAFIKECTRYFTVTLISCETGALTWSLADLERGMQTELALTF